MWKNGNCSGPALGRDITVRPDCWYAPARLRAVSFSSLPSSFPADLSILSSFSFSPARVADDSLANVTSRATGSFSTCMAYAAPSRVPVRSEFTDYDSCPCSPSFPLRAHFFCCTTTMLPAGSPGSFLLDPLE